AAKAGKIVGGVMGIGKTEVLKAGASQTGQIIQRVGAKDGFKYFKEVKKQMGPAMAMTGASMGASEIGTGEKYAGLAVAFIHGMISKGRLPQKIKFHGEPESVYADLRARGMLEQTPEGYFLKAGKSLIKLEPVGEKSGKSSGKQNESGKPVIEREETITLDRNGFETVARWLQDGKLLKDGSPDQLNVIIAAEQTFGISAAAKLVRKGWGIEVFVEPAGQKQLVEALKDRYQVKQTPDGIELRPYSAKPDSPPCIILRPAPEFTTKLPHEIAVENVVKADPSRLGKEGQWISTAVENVNSGNYRKAYDIARGAQEVNGQFTVDQVPLEPVNASDLLAGTAAKKHINSMRDAARAYKLKDGKMGVIEPQTIIKLESGALVDLMNPAKTMDGRTLTAEETKAINAVLESPQGKRIMAEHAFIMMEEMFHIKQFVNDGKPISQTYEEFLKTQGKVQSGPRTGGSYEQEVVAALRDAGLHPEVLRLYFENSHLARLEVMDFIRHKDGLISKPGDKPQKAGTVKPDVLRRQGDPVLDAIESLKQGEFADAYLEATSIDPAKATPRLREAIRDRIQSELKNPLSTAKASELADLAKLLTPAEKTLAITNGVKAFIERSVNDPKVSPKELIQLAREFGLLNESVKRMVMPRLLDETLSGDDRIPKLRALLNEGFAKDPIFCDELSDAIGRRIARADESGVAEIESLVRQFPELSLAKNEDLPVDGATSRLLKDLKSATERTDLEAQVERILNDPALLKDNEMLNRLYNSLKASKNQKIEAFLQKHPSKQAVIDSWKEQLRVTKFNQLMKNEEVTRLLSERPLNLDGPQGALAKFKQLMIDSGFPVDSKGNVVGFGDEVLTGKLRERARAIKIRET
ncbi:MAG: hypothetical protein K2Z81_26375, partial [Cyanobacteria bacterium]|nr:hypothetical protein [Cyanobacteriota bacterium]